MLPLNCWENQIRTRTKIQSTRTLEPRQSKISPWLAKRSPELGALLTYKYSLTWHIYMPIRLWDSPRPGKSKFIYHAGSPQLNTFIGFRNPIEVTDHQATHFKAYYDLALESTFHTIYHFLPGVWCGIVISQSVLWSGKVDSRANYDRSSDQ